MRPVSKKTKRVVSVVLLTAITFVLVCTAGFFECPQLGLMKGEVSSTTSQDFPLTCHTEPLEEGDESSKAGNSCQCNEISKSEDVSFQIEFAKLVRISIQKLYFISTLELPVIFSEFQIHSNSHLSDLNQFQDLQKTIKLLI